MLKKFRRVELAVQDAGEAHGKAMKEISAAIESAKTTKREKAALEALHSECMRLRNETIKALGDLYNILD